jgi:hypothetical protein
MTSNELLAIAGENNARIPAPHAWRDSLMASIFGYSVATVLLFVGFRWLGIWHRSQSQLGLGIVAVISFIDSLFGWGVFLVPIAFSYKAAPTWAQRFVLCATGSAIALVITGGETYVFLLEPRFRLTGTIYVAAGMLNALLATVALLLLRHRSAATASK